MHHSLIDTTQKTKALLQYLQNATAVGGMYFLGKKMENNSKPNQQQVFANELLQNNPGLRINKKHIELALQQLDKKTL
jgi:hypothetical protein